MQSILFRDVLFLMVLVLYTVLWIILPYFNPPAEEQAAQPPGNVMVSITWPDGDTDVDLWITGPGEIRPVGYSNKGGVLFDLLRDDLGTLPDITGLNYENAYSRGITPGEFIVNVHCYRCPKVPVPVAVEVSVNTGENGKTGMQRIAVTKTILDRQGQEKTALRFKLDATGALVPNSLNSVFRPLRSGE